MIDLWDIMDQNLVRPNDSLGFQGHKTSNFSYHTLSSPLKSLEKSQLPQNQFKLRKLTEGHPKKGVAKAAYFLVLFGNALSVLAVFASS